MYQKMIIIGNLGRAPEMRYTPSGQAVTNFSVATNYSYSNANGERIKETTWFRVSAWGKQAEICNQFLTTGSKVMVEGRLVADKETGGPKIYNKTDGSPASSFEIRSDRIVFLSSRGEQDSGNFINMEEPENDDIPF